MRILYDTNVLVATLSRHESILQFKRIVQGQVIHVSSPFILAEAETVLVEKMKVTKQKAKAATRLLARQSIIVRPKTIEKVCRDPFDDYIVAAAVAGKVEYLVTADQDLLVLGKYKNVIIITPRDFQGILDRDNQ